MNEAERYEIEQYMRGVLNIPANVRPTPYKFCTSMFRWYEEYNLDGAMDAPIPHREEYLLSLYVREYGSN